MNTNTIESAASPLQFVEALRAQADKCSESAAELQSAWQDQNAGKFWREAAKELTRSADKLAKVWDAL